jgi:RNA-binding protein 8A
MAGIDVNVQVEDGEEDFTEDRTDELKLRATKKKGRGFGETIPPEQKGHYDSIHQDDKDGPMRSIEGWIVFVRGLHEEAQEDDIMDKFSEFGDIKNIHVNLDRRTGYIKGYALVEYETYSEARDAISGLNNTDILGKTVEVDWAFVKPPPSGRYRRYGDSTTV